MQSSFKEHFQHLVFRKLLDWRLENSYSKEVAQQPRGEVSRQAKFFQPTQPIPKPICYRSGQPDNKHEEFVFKRRNILVSRDQRRESFHEELCSSDRSGQLDITPCVIRAQTNLSWEIRVEQTHDRSGQLDKHEIALRPAPEVHREITTLNTDNELTRERIEEDMGLQNSRTTTFYCEAIAECERSRIESENRERPGPTCSSTRLTTESII